MLISLHHPGGTLTSDIGQQAWDLERSNDRSPIMATHSLGLRLAPCHHTRPFLRLPIASNTITSLRLRVGIRPDGLAEADYSEPHDARVAVEYVAFTD